MNFRNRIGISENSSPFSILLPLHRALYSSPVLESFPCSPGRIPMIFTLFMVFSASDHIIIGFGAVILVDDVRQRNPVQILIDHIIQTLPHRECLTEIAS